MAFDSQPVLDLAKQLAELAASDGDEIKFRAAVGRAYYAVFLMAREETATTQQDNVHGEVIRRLRNRKGMIVADKLDSLRRLRIAADYEFPPVDEAHRDWTKNWSTAELLSEHVLSRLKRK